MHRVDADLLGSQLHGEVVDVVRDNLLGEPVAGTARSDPMPLVLAASPCRPRPNPVAMIDAPRVQVRHAACMSVDHADQVDVDRVDEGLRRTPAAIGHMPALATTMSSAPSSATPSSTAARHAAVRGRRRGRSRAPVLLLDQPVGLGEVLGPRERVLVGGDVRADVEGDDVGALRGSKSRVASPGRVPRR